MICSLSADTSRIQAQLDEVHALLKSASPELSKYFSGLFDSYFREPASDILVGEFVSTVGAGGAHELVCTPRLSGRFERLVAALRAGDFDFRVHGQSFGQKVVG